jgi:hypothetical protein
MIKLGLSIETYYKGQRLTSVLLRVAERTNFVSFDLIDFVQISDIADTTMRDKDVVVNQTGNGHPAVDVLE